METIDQTYRNLYFNGIYYCPASKHYPDRENVVVFCNRRRKSHLDVCIGGEGNLDLCLDCIKEISSVLRGICARDFFK
jgi:hypothetical protein